MLGIFLNPVRAFDDEDEENDEEEDDEEGYDEDWVGQTANSKNFSLPVIRPDKCSEDDAIIGRFFKLKTSDCRKVGVMLIMNEFL